MQNKVMKKILRISLLLSLVILTKQSFLVYGATSPNAMDRDFSSYEKEEKKEGNIQEAEGTYEKDQENPDSVLTMHLTVTKGNAADGSDHTWTEVNSHDAQYYKDLGVDRYKVEGLLKIDGDTKEERFGYDDQVPNVSVQVRGQTSSRNKQKNYKVRIKKGMGSFRGQRTLVLNKHMSMPFRFTNKMAYDLMQDVPELMASHTQFVHLYVTDMTEGGSGEEKDYGLYVMVEQMNKTYLRNHGLDDKGRMYKVTFFEWYVYDELMLDSEDPEYDVDAFEEYLEIKGSDDHSTLQEVVKKLNNTQIPIQEIVEEHFDVKNLMYWAAFQMLIGNYDAGARNLFIYSPQNSKKLYLISWDMDVAYMKNYHRKIERYEGLSWETGMSQFLGLILYQRLWKEEEYRQAFDDAVEDLYHNYLTKEKVEAEIWQDAKIVEEYLFREPDSEKAKYKTREEFEEAVSKMPSELEECYQLYKESWKRPWPFFVGLPEKEKDGLVLIWDAAYDYKQEDITYDYLVAKDYEFKEVVEEGHGLTIPSAKIKVLEEGQYFLKVTATNESGYTIDCFDYYTVSGKGKIYGCYSFLVDKNGKCKVYERKKDEKKEK